MANEENLDTVKVRDALSACVVDLKNEVDLTFQALEEPLNDINGTLESKFIKRFLVEFEKLRKRLCEELPESLETCISTLEEHDAEIESAFEELIEEEEEG